MLSPRWWHRLFPTSLSLTRTANNYSKISLSLRESYNIDWGWNTHFCTTDTKTDCIGRVIKLPTDLPDSHPQWGDVLALEPSVATPKQAAELLPHLLSSSTIWLEGLVTIPGSHVDPLVLYLRDTGKGWSPLEQSQFWEWKKKKKRLVTTPGSCVAQQHSSLKKGSQSW